MVTDGNGWSRWKMIAEMLLIAAFAAEEKSPVKPIATAPKWSLRKDPPRQATEGPRPAPVKAPANVEIEQSIRRGVDYLLASQNRSGSWGGARRTKDLNIYAPIPGAHHGFAVATTALALRALRDSADPRPDVVRCRKKGEDWLVKTLPILRRATQDAIYNVWGHGYALHALVPMLSDADVSDDLKKEVRALIALQFERLTQYESVDGGWGYYDFRYQTRKPSSDSTSFVSGAILVAFDEARRAGIEPPAAIVERAVASIKRQRKPDFTYLYAENHKFRPMWEINTPGGSLGRSQCCNIALRLWGDSQVNDAVLKNWLNRLFAQERWLDIGRKKPIPHESWMLVAGYFYYFGHFYAARCIEQLPPEDRRFFQEHLARRMIDRQEKDGSWFDYPFYDYHQPYGTAFAVSTLSRCRGNATGSPVSATASNRQP